CLDILSTQGFGIILFGMNSIGDFANKDWIDLRGKTTLLEMLAIVKNYCKYLLVPDSGILSILYYLNDTFPINVISLWSDPHQGILKQNVPSPNSKLHHF